VNESRLLPAVRCVELRLIGSIVETPAQSGTCQWRHVQVVLQLHVRKFYCDQPSCPRRIFAERLPQVTSPHGRFTCGLREFLAQLGREHGGAAGARSAHLQGLQVTERSILRLMHALPLPPIAAPQIIGLDEWAWKRGQRFGALIVDLERKKPIALLPDRSQQTVIHWLKGYPTITIVARDRGKRVCGRYYSGSSPRPACSRSLACREKPDRTLG
jgi:transposase